MKHRMDDFSERALQARENDEEFNRFAADSKSYILGCASKCLKRYIRDTDDEWSVALIAFHEAVRTYKPEKGSFGSFAGIVIRRRLLDEERRNAAYGSEIPVSPEVLVGEYSGDEEDAEGDRLVGNVRQSGGGESRETVGTTPLQDEIAAAQEILSAYGFSFFDLTEASPHSRKTREACASAVRLLSGDMELLAKMRKGHNLPVRELCNGTGLPRKLLDRHRRYIIAVVEILHGDFPLLAEYLDALR